MRRRQVRRRRLAALAVFLVALGALAFGARVFITEGADPASGASEHVAGRAVSESAAKSPSAARSSVASTSTSPAVSATSSPSSKVIEIGWVGDTVPGSRYGMPSNGGRALFANVRDELRAPDLMIANLEGTYSTAGPSKCDGVDSKVCFAFQAPPSYASALAWAGIDLVNLANNHSYDYLQRGFDQTKQALESANVEYTGLLETVNVVKVNGVRVATVGFSPYSWSPNVNDIPGAVALVERAADMGDVVVVIMHVGAEGADKIHTPKGPETAFGELRGDSRAFAHAMIDAGADLVLGSGPHVIRGIERYRHRLIAYSLGNFAGWGNSGTGGNLGLSGLLTVRVDQEGRPLDGRWHSLLMVSPGVPVVDSGHSAARLVKQLSAADFARTYDLDAEGAFSAR